MGERIYFDACCLNRPFDDKSIVRNRLEAEAFLVIMEKAKNGELIFIASEVLLLEIFRTKSEEKRKKVFSFMTHAAEMIEINDDIVKDARRILTLDIGPLDALHIACARHGRADVLLTTDDKFLKKGQKNQEELEILIDNPLDWIRNVGRR